MIRKIFQFLTAVLLVLGFLLSGYLLLRYVQLASSGGAGGSDICAAVFGASCDETLASSYTVQFGLPLPGWGLVYYALLTSLMLIAGIVRPFLRLASSSLFVLVSISGAVFSLLLASVMVSGRAANCPVCYGIHAVNLLIVPAGYLQSGYSWRELVGAWMAGLRYVAGGTMREPDLASGRVLGLLVPFLVGLAVYQGVLIQLQIRLGSGGDSVQADHVLAAYEATPAESIPVHPDNGTWGPEQAWVEMVVFSDFQCPACAEFAFMLEELRRQFDAQVRVVFKHYPLDSACNPTIEEPFHEKACEAARLVQAANEMGKFREAHDILFGMELSEGLRPAAQAVAEATGLDPEMLRRRMEAPEIEEIVSRDIREGVELGLPGTPSVFVNGRLLLDTRQAAIRLLLVHLLQEDDDFASAP